MRPAHTVIDKLNQHLDIGQNSGDSRIMTVLILIFPILSVLIMKFENP